MLTALIRLVALTAFLWLDSPLAAQTSLALEPIRDNTLYESATGNASNGAGAGMFCGLTQRSSKRRAVLAFDVQAAVPRGARIASARLVLRMDMTIAGDLTIGLHRMLAGFGEGSSSAGFGGEGGGAPAAVGDATWRHTAFPQSFWTNPGGDFASVSSASAVAGRLVGDIVWSGPALTQDVQQWLDQPTSAHGWLLLSPEVEAGNAKRFATRNHPDPTLRPRLELEWVLPGTATSFGDDLAIIATLDGQASAFAAVFVPAGSRFGCRIQSPNGTLAGLPLLIAFDAAPNPSGFLPALLPGQIAVGADFTALVGGPMPLLPLPANLPNGPGLALEFGPLMPVATGLHLRVQALVLAQALSPGNRTFATTDALLFRF